MSSTSDNQEKDISIWNPFHKADHVNTGLRIIIILLIVFFLSIDCNYALTHIKGLQGGKKTGAIIVMIIFGGVLLTISIVEPYLMLIIIVVYMFIRIMVNDKDRSYISSIAFPSLTGMSS